MHGRPLLLSRVIVLGAAAWLVAGCEPPRIKSLESYTSATKTDPPRDFRAAPLDPYSYGGIAGATGGVDPRGTYGALGDKGNMGADPIYRPSITHDPKEPDYSAQYLIPDAKKQPQTSQYLASTYLDDEGRKIADVGILTKNPPRAGLVAPSPQAKSAESH